MERLAYGGETIGRLPDGRVVFTPFAIPGELVRLRIVEEKPRYAIARLEHVLRPSPERVLPRCRHYTECGGCHYQHLSYPAQLDAKASILQETLQRKIQAPVPAVRLIQPSPQAWEYRNTIQLHLNRDGKLGYNRWRSSEVIPISECHLPQPSLNQIWPQLDFDADCGIERVGLRLGVDDDVQIILEGDDPALPSVLVEELPVSVVHLSPAGMQVLAGSPFVYMRVLGRDFRVSAASFFQVNIPVAELMIQYLLTELKLGQKINLVDACCGVGLFSAFLAAQVGKLIGIEVSPTACEDFVANLDEFDNVELYEASIEVALHRLDIKPDIILVDPPRSGLSPEAIQGIMHLNPKTLVYISCDPATLARDSRKLHEGGYALQQVALFDMFPQTSNIESITLWAREN